MPYKHFNRMFCSKSTYFLYERCSGLRFYTPALPPLLYSYYQLIRLRETVGHRAEAATDTWGLNLGGHFRHFCGRGIKATAGFGSNYRWLRLPHHRKQWVTVAILVVIGRFSRGSETQMVRLERIMHKTMIDLFFEEC